ncbi:MAG: hypothetical protein CBC38_01025 [Gammaproteobacteria bacterium TMED78]|nr:MAG: hypothetical protein CBC38_01025 [Gammaproteobacteria bacterium TMED78]
MLSFFYKSSKIERKKGATLKNIHLIAIKTLRFLSDRYSIYTFFTLCCLVSLLFYLPKAISQEDIDQYIINQIVIACEQLEHDYAIYRDQGDAEAFANIFTEQGEWGRPREVIKGREAIKEYVINSNNNSTPEVHMQLTSTIQIKPINETTATGISYAVVLEAPIDENGLPVTLLGFQVASESRSIYKLTSEGWKIDKREYTTLFVDPD